MTEIRCVGIGVRYANGDWGLRDVTFDVAAGSRTAVTGPSGAGKSTLLNALCGLAPITAGEVSVGGVRVDQETSDQLARLRRSSFGIVFQQGLLLPELSVADNVALPLRLLGRSRREARARSAEVLTQLRLAKLSERMPWQLSGGQRQRIAVARAIAHRPSIVLADEPTGSLDSENAELTMNVLLDATTSIAATLVVVTHSDVVADRCEQRISVRDGRSTVSAA